MVRDDLWTAQKREDLWNPRAAHADLTWPQLHKLNLFPGRSVDALYGQWRMIRKERRAAAENDTENRRNQSQGTQGEPSGHERHIEDEETDSEAEDIEADGEISPLRSPHVEGNLQAQFKTREAPKVPANLLDNASTAWIQRNSEPATIPNNEAVPTRPKVRRVQVMLAKWPNIGRRMLDLGRNWPHTWKSALALCVRQLPEEDFLVRLNSAIMHRLRAIGRPCTSVELEPTFLNLLAAEYPPAHLTPVTAQDIRNRGLHLNEVGMLSLTEVRHDGGIVQTSVMAPDQTNRSHRNQVESRPQIGLDDTSTTAQQATPPPSAAKPASSISPPTVSLFPRNNDIGADSPTEDKSLHKSRKRKFSFEPTSSVSTIPRYRRVQPSLQPRTPLTLSVSKASQPRTAGRSSLPAATRGAYDTADNGPPPKRAKLPDTLEQGISPAKETPCRSATFQPDIARSRSSPDLSAGGTSTVTNITTPTQLPTPARMSGDFSLPEAVTASPEPKKPTGNNSNATIASLLLDLESQITSKRTTLRHRIRSLLEEDKANSVRLEAIKTLRAKMEKPQDLTLLDFSNALSLLGTVSPGHGSSQPAPDDT